LGGGGAGSVPNIIKFHASLTGAFAGYEGETVRPGIRDLKRARFIFCKRFQKKERRTTRYTGVEIIHKALDFGLKINHRKYVRVNRL
jgi:hypothetical protein